TGDSRPYYAVGWDYITDPTPIAAGAATVRGSYSGAIGNTCLAALAGTEPDESLACVYPGKGACAAAGEIETIYMPYSMVQGSVESATFASWGSIAFGVVWDTATGKPLAGARVEVPAEAR